MKGSSRVRGIVAAAASAFAVSAICASPAPGTTERVSVDSGESQANHMSSRRGRPVLSYDGVIAVFDSLASNLVPGDTNNADDIFVRDREAGTTQRVSISTDGAQAIGTSVGPSVSASGLVIAFESSAANLVADDTNAVTDIFVHDRATGKTIRASLSTSGTQGDRSSFIGSISGDGRYVVFSSDATNLVPDKTTLFRDVYVRDLVAGTTERVNLSDGEAEAAGNSFASAISADGRFVAFSSLAPNLVPGDANGQVDIFVRDRVAGTTERVSVTSAGVEANGFNLIPAISADGRFVAFGSEATNLVPGDTNGVRDVFVHDRETRVTERVSVADDEQQANGQSIGPGVRGGPVFGAVISANGRFVAFDSAGSNLVAGDTNTCQSETVVFEDSGTCPDIFVRDRLAGTTRRFSVSDTGVQGDSASTDPGLSGNGLSVAFFSLATNLVANDTNTCAIPPQVSFDIPGECPDIFVHDSTLLPAGPGDVARSLRLAKVGGSLRLSWSSTCSNLVTDYGIYQGDLGLWESHTAVDCEDDGLDLQEDLVLTADDSYFLVVPREGTAVEGSYGVTSAGAERPVGTSTCATEQRVGSCP